MSFRLVMKIEFMVIFVKETVQEEGSKRANEKESGFQSPTPGLSKETREHKGKE